MLGVDELHKPSYVVVVVVAIVFGAADIVFACFFSGICGISPFENGTLQVFHNYPTPFTPKDYAAPVITILLAVWQVALMIYSVSTLFRYTSYGYLYIAPGHSHPQIYIAYTSGLVLHMTWLVVLNTLGPSAALYIIPFATFFMFLAYGVSCHRLYFRGHILQREGAQREALYVRLAFQNALAIYATWLFLLTLLNLDMALIYHFDVDWKVSGTIVHATLLLYIVVWFFLDNFVCDKFLRYTFSPYLVFLIYLTGCFSNKWSADAYMLALVAFILGVAVLLAVLKLALLIKNQLTSPLWLGNGFFVHYQSYGSLDHKSSERTDDYY